MGDQVKILQGGSDVPVEPIGNLITEGWLPGTWVKMSAELPSLTPGVVGTVERADGLGYVNGFLRTGPQHNQPVIELSDMWTTYQRQVPGGDTHSDWSSFDPGGPLIFDRDKQLQRLGSRVVTMRLLDNMLVIFYVFETLSRSARHGGPGGPLVYNVGDRLYCSENGLLTNERETPNHIWLGAVVGAVGSNFEGDFIIFTSAVIVPV